MSNTVTLLFPGQGSQKVGMGKSLEDHNSFELFKEANDILGYNLSKIIFEGPEEELKLTYNAQPAILTYSTALLMKLKEILKKNNYTVERVLGHSLGEYSALIAAGVLSFSDAVKAVHLRGRFMQESVSDCNGSMYAIMKVPEDMVIKACTEASNDKEIVMPANFNEPNQIVISGESNACKRAVKWLEENAKGKIRAIELQVSAPFHSTFMQPAAEKLKVALEQFSFNSNSVPYIANIDAFEYGEQTDQKQIKENLVKQVTGSVLWTQSIKKLPSNTLCVEVGPGKVLAGLVRKINSEIRVISLDRETAFNDLKELLS